MDASNLLKPALAGGVDPLHRLDHLQGIPQLFREGPGAGPPLPEDRRQRADDRGFDQDPARPQALLRAAPQGPLHGRRDQGGGRAVAPLHRRPQAARQGDRRDRRVGRGADAAARKQAPQDDHRQGGRGLHRDDGAHPAEERVARRPRGAEEPDARPRDDGVRPGQGDRGAGVGDQARPRRIARPGEADRLLPVLRARPASARPRSRASSPARSASRSPASTCRNTWSGTRSRG